MRFKSEVKCQCGQLLEIETEAAQRDGAVWCNDGDEMICPTSGRRVGMVDFVLGAFLELDADRLIWECEPRCVVEVG